MAKFWPQMAKFWPSQNFPDIYTMIFSKKTTRVVSIPTRPSMIGSPERVKIQRSLVQNLSKIQQRLKIIVCFLTFWGIKIPPDGHNKFLGVKITSKMNSQHRQNTECENFQKNLTTFKKSLS